MHPIPKYEEDDPSQYIAALAAYDCDLGMVKSWRRHASVFIDIPFGIEDSVADGVICIDIIDGLEAVPNKVLCKFASMLHDTYGTTFALLWRLRVQM